MGLSRVLLVEESHQKECRTLIFPEGSMPPPQDWRRFVQFDKFVRDWKRLGLDDDDLRGLEMLIMINPSIHPVVPGTGGLKKMRFAAEKAGQGKRGGIRVCYVDFPDHGTILLLAAYAKNEKDDLTMKARHQIKLIISDIKDLLKGK